MILVKCPLKSYEYSEFIDCAGRSCAFADEAGDCLVRQALQCYISAERARVAEENDRLYKEIELAKTYWAFKKDGTRNIFDNPFYDDNRPKTIIPD